MSSSNSIASIIIIGAGGIVETAHIPAYKKAGYTIQGITDINIEKAQSLALKSEIPVVYASLQEAISASGEFTVFDIAVPASGIIEIIRQLPDRAGVLIQKPMGENLQQAKEILDICRQKKIRAGVNFQLRYAPYILKAKEIIAKGLIGEICDVEINVNVLTPWHLWDFLFNLPRMEILYHSIHYIDLVRSLLGNPFSVFARTIKHPEMKELASVRSVICMDYGEWLRANILTNHGHAYGLKHQHSYVRIEGSKGAIYIKMGLSMDYPKGVPDELEYISFAEGESGEWQSVDFQGSWFPEAFIGSMGEILNAMENEQHHPDNSVEDCIQTMACVEAAYMADQQGGIAINQLF